MTDLFHYPAASLESPASHLQTVTPSDEADLDFTSRAIAAGADGFVQVTTKSGTIGRVFVIAGAPFPIRATRIWASGTTATDIVALA